MMVDTHLDPSMEIYQNTPIGNRVNTRARAVIPPSNHPYVTPFSYGRHGPNNSTIVMFEPMTNTFDEFKLKYTW